ncbi:hypothetical protein ACJX0J_039341, partial [Zea mays]
PTSIVPNLKIVYFFIEQSTSETNGVNIDDDHADDPDPIQVVDAPNAVDEGNTSFQLMKAPAIGLHETPDADIVGDINTSFQSDIFDPRIWDSLNPKMLVENIFQQNQAIDRQVNELINLLAFVIKSAIIAKVKEAKGTKKGQGYDNGSTKETFGYKSKSLLFSLWFLVRWNILKENIKGLTLKWLKLIRSEIAAGMDIHPMFRTKRKIKRKRQFDECVDDPSIEINYFLPIVDQAIASLTRRFEQYQGFEKTFGFFKEHKDIDGTELFGELILIQDLLKKSMGPLDILEILLTILKHKADKYTLLSTYYFNLKAYTDGCYEYPLIYY